MSDQNNNNKEMLNHIFAYDGEKLVWKNPTHPRIKAGSIAGYTMGGYVCLELFGRSEKAHRIIWEMYFGEIPKGYVIDHKDGNGLNNRLTNLRLATHAENMRNSKKRKNTTSKYKGVTYRKADKKWYAVIQVENKRVHLGSFKTEEEAHAEYCKVASVVFEDFFSNGGFHG